MASFALKPSLASHRGQDQVRLLVGGSGPSREPFYPGTPVRYPYPSPVLGGGGISHPLPTSHVLPEAAALAVSCGCSAVRPGPPGAAPFPSPVCWTRGSSCAPQRLAASDVSPDASSLESFLARVFSKAFFKIGFFLYGYILGIFLCFKIT